MSDFAAERTVTACAQHRCHECFRTIEVGERYQRAAGMWWGEFWHATTCAHCAALRPLLQEVAPDYHENYYGGLHEALQDWRDELPVPLLRALVNMRRGWRRRDGSLLGADGAA